MIETTETLERRLSDLRIEFDRAFAQPFGAPAVEREDLLAISLNDDPYAIRVRELRGLHVDQVIRTLPTAAADLVGLAAIRGELVAVYDLAALLGYARCEAPRHVLLATTAGLGFAFDSSSRHLRIATSVISAQSQPGQRWLSEVVRDGQLARPIIELRAVCASIEERIRSEGTEENAK